MYRRCHRMADAEQYKLGSRLQSCLSHKCKPNAAIAVRVLHPIANAQTCRFKILTKRISSQCLFRDKKKKKKLVRTFRSLRFFGGCFCAKFISFRFFVLYYVYTLTARIRNAPCTSTYDILLQRKLWTTSTECSIKYPSLLLNTFVNI